MDEIQMGRDIKAHTDTIRLRFCDTDRLEPSHF